MANRFNPYYNRTNTCDNIKEDGYKCKEKLYPKEIGLGDGFVENAGVEIIKEMIVEAEII